MNHSNELLDAVTHSADTWRRMLLAEDYEAAHDIHTERGCALCVFANKYHMSCQSCPLSGHGTEGCRMCTTDWEEFELFASVDFSGSVKSRWLTPAHSMYQNLLRIYEEMWEYAANKPDDDGWAKSMARAVEDMRGKQEASKPLKVSHNKYNIGDKLWYDRIGEWCIVRDVYPSHRPAASFYNVEFAGGAMCVKVFESSLRPNRWEKDDKVFWDGYGASGKHYYPPSEGIICWWGYTSALIDTKPELLYHVTRPGRDTTLTSDIHLSDKSFEEPKIVKEAPKRYVDDKWYSRMEHGHCDKDGNELSRGARNG